ncbi:MAG TPA: tripartite tricarboxylate transporter permease, partial [Kiloniellales bacterium]|nr:tripartite tricarboxylate transporter permease [Kiloniellales bacterium]
MFDLIFQAAQHIFVWPGILYLFLGSVLGLVFGVIPGLGGTTALALLIPLTFDMESFHAMLLAGGVMGSVAFGGSITAILINTPGIAPNAATCFDGYPLAQQGKAGLAIGASATASAVGGVLGLLTLLAVIPIAKEIVLLFSPPEFLLLALLGLCAIAVSSRGRLLRGLIAGGFGLILAFVGYDAVTGGIRFTMGSEYLWEGIPLVPTLIGLFAIAQMIELTIKGGSVAADAGAVRITRVTDGIRAVFHHWPILVRGSVIGTTIGAVPGLGGTVASFLAYSSTVQVAKDPDSFGRGNIAGVIAPESANNAKDGGALIPTIAFGIPGSAEMALFLGILVLHGMDPGPTILLQYEHEVYGLILAIVISCCGASIFGLLVARWLSLITTVDVHILVPVVVAISVVGAYVLQAQPPDIILATIFGFIGYLMIKFDYPRLTLVIALVLGETAERSFHQTMMISDHDWSIFITRTPSLILLAAIVVTLLLPGLRSHQARR